jgi:hypothetical protein
MGGLYMIAQNPLASLHKVSNAEVSLKEWRKQALVLQEEFGQENRFIRARIKSLLNEIDRLGIEFGD